jgi:hypothetical protein
MEDMEILSKWQVQSKMLTCVLFGLVCTCPQLEGISTAEGNWNKIEDFDRVEYIQ